MIKSTIKSFIKSISLFPKNKMEAAYILKSENEQIMHVDEHNNKVGSVSRKQMVIPIMKH